MGQRKGIWFFYLLRPLFTGELHCRSSALLPQEVPLTILGLAGAVIGLQQVTFNTATREGAIRVGAKLAAGAIHRTLVKICPERKGRENGHSSDGAKILPADWRKRLQFRTCKPTTRQTQFGIYWVMHTDSHSLRKQFLDNRWSRYGRDRMNLKTELHYCLHETGFW